MQEKYFWGATEDGFHKIVYREYGQRGKPVLVAVHGLTRNCFDFHFLAQSLQDSFHVFALDMVGRGNSDYVDPKHYTYPQYIMDLTAFLARIDVPEVYWIGTSMGGLLGMIMGSFKNTPIRKLILNDVGPMVTSSVIKRLLDYAGIQLKAPTRQHMIDMARQVYAPFGFIQEKDWQELMAYNIHEQQDGSYTLAYDPLVTKQLEDQGDNHSDRDEEGNLTLWSYWEKLTCPVYVINGLKSDLLTPSILNKMASRGPSFQYYGVPDAGHAPWLIEDDICHRIREWLEEKI